MQSGTSCEFDSDPPCTADHLQEPGAPAPPILAGQGTDHTGAGLGLPLGHAISTRYGLETGLVDAIILPHVLRFNAEAAATGIQKAVAALGGTLGVHESGAAAATVASTLGNLFQSLSLPKRLRDVGVERSSLSEIAAIAFDDWFLQGNPRPIKDAAELLQLLEEAW